MQILHVASLCFEMFFGTIWIIVASAGSINRSQRFQFHLFNVHQFCFLMVPLQVCFRGKQNAPHTDHQQLVGRRQEKLGLAANLLVADILGWQALHLSLSSFGCKWEMI
jgi:hypothetical protein